MTHKNFVLLIAVRKSRLIFLTAKALMFAHQCLISIHFVTKCLSIYSTQIEIIKMDNLSIIHEVKFYKVLVEVKTTYQAIVPGRTKTEALREALLLTDEELNDSSHIDESRSAIEASEA
jgi:TctA family transporter